MSVLLFEDELVSQLYPVTIGRPAFEINCGSYRLIELVRQLDRPIGAVVRPHLRETLRADLPDLAAGLEHARGTVLLINARLVPRIGILKRLAALLESGRQGIVHTGESVAAAVVKPEEPVPEGDVDLPELLAWLAGQKLPSIEADLPLFEYPHDLIRYHGEALQENVEHRLSVGNYREIADGVFAAAGAKLGEYCTVDQADGPVLVDEDATIGPYCFLHGPAYIGPRARVIEHAAIKDGVALGHTAKIGGEIEASIIEPYTNKQHHGFIGHSYLGSWVNLGAGTCNSDLKNTYGQVSMEYDRRKVSTGMQFIGCIIGDYAKTAINTSIFTGKTIGACTMVYGFVTTNVPSFVNYARLFGQVTEAPVEVMIATQARMFARRNVKQRDCDVQLLRDMYELTRHERQIAVEPLSL